MWYMEVKQIGLLTWKSYKLVKTKTVAAADSTTLTSMTNLLLFLPIPQLMLLVLLLLLLPFPPVTTTTTTITTATSAVICHRGFLRPHWQICSRKICSFPQFTANFIISYEKS